MAQCMKSGIAPASSCGMKVGRSPRDRRNGRDKVRPFHNCSNLTGRLLAVSALLGEQASRLFHLR